MARLSPAQAAAYQRFLDAFDQGDAYMDANPAMGGWSQEERWQMRSLHASNVNRKTLVALRRRGLIRHVGDGFHVINTH